MKRILLLLFLTGCTTCAPIAPSSLEVKRKVLAKTCGVTLYEDYTPLEVAALKARIKNDQDFRKCILEEIVIEQKRYVDEHRQF